MNSRFHKSNDYKNTFFAKKKNIYKNPSALLFMACELWSHFSFCRRIRTCEVGQVVFTALYDLELLRSNDKTWFGQDSDTEDFDD